MVIFVNSGKSFLAVIFKCICTWLIPVSLISPKAGVNHNQWPSFNNLPMQRLVKDFRIQPKWGSS